MRESLRPATGPRSGTYAAARLLTTAVIVAMLLGGDHADGTTAMAALHGLVVPIAFAEIVLGRRPASRRLAVDLPIVATALVGLTAQVLFHTSVGGALLIGFSVVELGLRCAPTVATAAALAMTGVVIRHPSYDVAGEPQSIASIVVGMGALLLAGMAARLRHERVTARGLEQLRAEFRLEAVTESIPSAVFCADDDGTLRFANSRFRALVGDVVGPTETPFWGRVHPDDSAIVRDALDLRRGTFEVRFRLRTADGSYQPVLAKGQRETQDPHQWVCVIEDLSAVESARAAEAELAAVVRSTSDHVVTWTADGRLVFANAAAVRAFSLPRDITDVHAADLFDDGGHMALDGPVAHLLESDGMWTGELKMRSATGRVFPVLQTLVVHRDSGGRISRTSMIGHDVSGFRAREEHLLHLVHHDPLTGLANRLGMLDLLDTMKQEGRPFALLYLDLDGFKVVNDTHGHPVGDEVLLTVARRIQQAIRPGDRAARVGGDEFVVVCGDIADDGRAARMASRLQAAIENDPVVTAGRLELPVRVSIGAALSTEVAVPAMIEHADAAMYEVKRRSSVL